TESAQTCHEVTNSASAPTSPGSFPESARRPALSSPRMAQPSSPKPRVLFVGRTRYRLPLSESLRKKWDALGELIDYRVLATAADDRSRGADERFALARPDTGAG